MGKRTRRASACRGRESASSTTSPIGDRTSRPRGTGKCHERSSCPAWAAHPPWQQHLDTLGRLSTAADRVVVNPTEQNRQWWP